MTMLSPAEHMNRQYRFQRHIYDLTRMYYLLWRSRAVEGLKPQSNAVVVEVACGTGWNLIRASQMYPNAHHFGLDISSEMLATARSKIASQGLAQRVVVAQADATNFDLQSLFNCRGADRILISYALSMIPDWPAVIERAIGSLNRSGEIHIVDFGDMERMPALARRLLRTWLTHYNVSPRDDLANAVSDFARRHDLEWTFEQSSTGYAAHAVLVRSDL